MTMSTPSKAEPLANTDRSRLAAQNRAAAQAKTNQVVNDRSASRLNQPKKTAKAPFLSKTWHKVLLGVGIFILLLLIVVGVVGWHFSRVAKQVKADGLILANSAEQLMTDLKGQNIPQAAQTLTQVQTDYDLFVQSYQKLLSLKFIPGYGQYLVDGQTALTAGQYALSAAENGLSAVLPYADLLGFAGEGSFEGGTAEDRVKTIIETLDKITPELDVIQADLEQTKNTLDQIDPSRYPETPNQLFGFKVASLFASDLKDYGEFPLKQTATELVDGVDQLTTTFTEYRPVIEQLPKMLGGSGEQQKYLVLFQNDNELRPTGGFLTAYSIMTIENGKITPEKSDDIYELDKKFTKQIPIPAELGKYLTTEKTWHLRDMNIDPDFKQSMDIFLENYQTVKGEAQDIDGIIAIDTKVLTDLIDILGPVEVGGYGTFSTEPDTKYTDAPQVVVALSEIITRPTPYIREDRKGILGPMMKAMLEKVYGAPKEQFAQLFSAAINLIEGRHVQVYFLDPQFQAAVETINAAGRMKAPVDGSDFLAIVDANLGGAKSNLFISYDVIQEIEAPEANTLTKKVSITYRNSRPGDNCNLEAGLLCLNSTNNDWQRIYLPAGAELTNAQGYKSQPTTYSEGEFTVVDGFFSLDPNKTAKVVLEYTVPYNYADQEEYSLYIWKQGGIDLVKHLLNVNGNEEEIDVVKDTYYQAKF